MIPLFKPKPLTGKYVGEVLASGHLVTGPMVERLRVEAAKLGWVAAEKVAVGASATACLQAIHAMIGWVHLELKPKATWPLFRDKSITNELWGYKPPDEDCWTLYTDIGGVTAPTTFGERSILDCSHSWEPGMLGGQRFSFASISPIKLCDGVQGGVIWCRHEDEARELQGILNYGFLDGHDKPRDWRTRDTRGWRWNMSDVHAALNLEAIERLKETKRRYNETCTDMFEALEWSPQLAKRPGGSYLCQLKVRSVPRAIEFLRERGVAAGWNFPPAKLVTIPAWPGLPAVNIKEVAQAARRMLEVEWK